MLVGMHLMLCIKFYKGGGGKSQLKMFSEKFLYIIILAKKWSFCGQGYTIECVKVLATMNKSS